MNRLISCRKREANCFQSHRAADDDNSHALECRWVNNAALPDSCYLLVSPPVHVYLQMKYYRTQRSKIYIGTLYKYAHLPFIINTNMCIIVLLIFVQPIEPMRL